MVDAGNVIARHSDTITEAFGSPVEVVNYQAGSRDDYGDPERVPTDASPHETDAQIDATADGEETHQWGEDAVVDAVVYLPDEIPVYDTSDRVYPSRLTATDTGRVYDVTAYVTPGNGFHRVAVELAGGSG